LPQEIIDIMTPYTPKISVVIPVYNGALFIQDALQSVLSQTAPPIEIIVVDDGSTDGTMDVVRLVNSTVPIRYRRQENQGPSAARNLGVSMAGGDWIAFLDADDIWHPERLAIQADLARAHPDVALFSSETDYIDEKGNARPPIDWQDELAPLMLNRPTPILPSTVTVKKAAFMEAGGFNPLLRTQEDIELFARIATGYPIQSIDRPLVKYRCHSKQLHRNREWRAQSWPILFHSLTEMWKDAPEKQAILAKRAAAVFEDLGTHYLRTGQYMTARAYLRQSISLNPWSLSKWRRWGIACVPAIREWYRLRKGNQ
jgi:glycosyltransferase involved in cell wall biosynthesis